MTKEKLIEFIKTLPGAVTDKPFSEDFESVVARHSDNRKWFGLIMKIDSGEIINLKCEPVQADFLRSVYKGVIPAYHMNKTHWNSVFLESDVPDEEMERMVRESFMLTASAAKKKALNAKERQYEK